MSDVPPLELGELLDRGDDSLTERAVQTLDILESAIRPEDLAAQGSSRSRRRASA
jgi:hypothetical protein